MTNAANRGLMEKRLRQGRQADAVPNAAMGYATYGGQIVPQQGDDDGPWSKVPPFPTAPAPWYQHTFAATGYLFLRTLEIGNVRTVTAYVDVLGGSSGASVLSILAGAVMPGASEELATTDEEQFYPIGVVGTTPANVTLGTPFSSPAVSRNVMPAEFRTSVIANNVHARFTLQWDVTPYQRFTLALADLGYADDDGLTVNVKYSTAS